MLDYRPALRERTGVGEYVHELTRALARTGADEISVLTVSWKDRPAPDLPAELGHVRIVDRRVPVRGLTWSWNRLGWPPVEWLAGPSDVVHSQSPLARAALFSWAGSAAAARDAYRAAIAHRRSRGR